MPVQWELLFFSLFVALGMGSFAFVAVTEITDTLEDVRLPGVITSMVALGIGGFASFLHLGHPDRIFHMLGNLKSGISQEFISTTIIMVVVFWYAILLVKKDSSKKQRKNLAIAGLVLSCLVVLSTGKIYLLGARPAWDTLLIPFLYLATAAPLGMFTMYIWVSLRSDDEVMIKKVNKFAFLSQCLFAVMVVAYLIYLSGASFPDPSRSPARLLSGDLAQSFWGLVVGAGLVVPMLLTASQLRAKRITAGPVIAGLGLVCVMVGAGTIRALQYLLGTSVHQFLTNL